MTDLAFAIEDRGVPLKRERKKPKPQPELVSRKALDLRLAANRQFNQIVASITADLGTKRLSTLQKHLIEAFAGTAVIADAINVRMLRGETIDDELIKCLTASSTAASTLVRLSQRIGVKCIGKAKGLKSRSRRRRHS